MNESLLARYDRSMLKRIARPKLGLVVLWAAMLAATGVCAAGSYEHTVIVPEWTAAPPESIAMFHGPYALDTGRWWRTVHFPTLLLSIGAFVLLRGHPRRAQIGGAVVGYLLLLVLTVGWILPELMALTGDPAATIPPVEWGQRAKRWEVLSLLRLGLMYGNAALLVWAAADAVTPKDGQVLP